jgi:tetratricopeptide (TPR) repeat protein
MISDISTNKDITVQSVLMSGYASPESSQQFNTELSRARAESMMRYFMKNSSIISSLFETRTGGEDWEGLSKMLEEMPLQNKSEILRIISSVRDLDEREDQIKKVGGGQPYKIIYEEIYPKLRCVKCEVNYTVKDFSIDEAKKNLKTAPQLLSQNEMFIVANSYPVGSADFLQVFEIACEEFPDDPIANLNRAAVALLKKQFREAEKYLNLSDKTSPEYANNTGVYLMLKGDYTEAERTLKQAESSGVEEATANLRELRKKVANIRNRREAGVNENFDTDDVEQPTGNSNSRNSRR